MYVHDYTHTHSIAVMQADLFRNCYYRGGNIEAMGDGRDGKGSSCSRYWLACRRAADWAASARRFAADARSGSLPPPCHLVLGKRVVHMQPFRMRLLPPAFVLLLLLVTSTIRVFCVCVRSNKLLTTPDRQSVQRGSWLVGRRRDPCAHRIDLHAISWSRA